MATPWLTTTFVVGWQLVTMTTKHGAPTQTWVLAPFYRMLVLQVKAEVVTAPWSTEELGVGGSFLFLFTVSISIFIFMAKLTTKQAWHTRYTTSWQITWAHFKVIHSLSIWIGILDFPMWLWHVEYWLLFPVQKVIMGSSVKGRVQTNKSNKEGNVSGHWSQESFLSVLCVRNLIFWLKRNLIFGSWPKNQPWIRK